MRPWREERTAGDATPTIIPKKAGFMPICAVEDIGTKEDWAAAQRVFILSCVSKGMGVSTGNSEESGFIALSDGMVTGLLFEGSGRRPWPGSGCWPLSRASADPRTQLGALSRRVFWPPAAGCLAIHVGYAPGCLRSATGKTPLARADRSRSKAMAGTCTLQPLTVGYELFAIPPPPSRR